MAAVPVMPGELVLNGDFWVGILLITFFFLTASVIERTSLGNRITWLLNRLSEPLAHRMGGLCGSSPVHFLWSYLLVAVFI